MGKRNPKHSKKHAKRLKKNTSSHTKFRLSANFYDRENVPIPPKTPSNTRAELIQKNYEEVLLEIESTFVQEHIYASEGLISDKDVLRTLARILWEKISWKYRKKRPPKNLASEIKLYKKHKKLSTSIMSVLGKLYKMRIRALRENEDAQVFHPLLGKISREKALSYKKDAFWDCLAVLYGNCRQWYLTHDSTGYLEYISISVPPHSRIEDLKTSLSGESQNFDSSQGLSGDGFDPKVMEDEIARSDAKIISMMEQSQNRAVLSKTLRRVNEVQKSTYSNNELRGYQAISDGIYKFSTIDPHLLSSLPSEGVIEKKLRKVKTHFTRAMKLLPKNVELYHSLMAIEMYNRNFEQVGRMYQKIPGRFKGDKISLHLLASSLMEKKEYDQALKTYECLLKVEGSGETKADVWAQKGYCYEVLQDIEKAVHCFKEAKKLVDESNSSDYEYIDSEIAKLEATRQMNLERSQNAEDPIKIQCINSYNYLDLVSRAIRVMDRIHFIGNKALQRELIKEM